MCQIGIKRTRIFRRINNSFEIPPYTDDSTILAYESEIDSLLVTIYLLILTTNYPAILGVNFDSLFSPPGIPRLLAISPLIANNRGMPGGLKSLSNIADRQQLWNCQSDAAPVWSPNVNVNL